MLKEIVSFTIASMVEKGEDFEKDEFDSFACKSLSQWSEQDWKACRTTLVNLRVNVLQRGATASINDEDNAAAHPGRCRSNIYIIDKLLRTIDVHVIFSPLRGPLMEQLCNEKLKGAAEVDEKLLSDFVYVSISAHRPSPTSVFMNIQSVLLSLSCNRSSVAREKDMRIKKPLNFLLTENESTGDLQLKELGTLRSIVLSSPFSFEKFSAKVIQTLQEWATDMFETPRLHPVYFPDEDEEEEADMEEQDQDAAVNNLRSARSGLKESFQDPLEETLEQAAKATRGSKRSPRVADEVASGNSPRKLQKVGHLLHKKATARALTFDDSVQDDETENLSEPGDDAVLSDLPERAKSRSVRVQIRSSMSPRKPSQIKKYAGRRQWTDEEKRAIKEGIRQRGVGNWADIKELYFVVLRDRTSGQIKDCFRTMKKRGELGDLYDV
jgi:hypothetical protein